MIEKENQKDSFEIRIPKKDDFEQMFKFIDDSSKSLFNNTFGDKEWEDIYEFKNGLKDYVSELGRGNILLGFKDRELVGIIILYKNKEEKFKHVANLALSVKYDSLFESLGKQLLNKMLNIAKVKGVVRKINIKVREDLHSAKKLYEEVGFYEEGVLARDICLNGMFYSTILYGRNID
ncbi:MAG: GNAT family N-acetyltransferase [Clostridium sp.]|nr:GNAT family N-acetyltransferase [Clostridium sp.]